MMHMSDAQRIVWLENYIKEIANTIVDIREEVRNDSETSNKLARLENDISRKSRDGEFAFITGAWYMSC